MDSKELDRFSRRMVGWVCGGAVMLLVLILALPRFSLFEPASSTMLIVHLLLEMFSVVVAMLVVAIAWHAFTPEERRSSSVLIFAFTMVAGMDLIHAVSYEGMPALGSPSSTSKAIFFWFMGRGVELLAVWLLAMRVQLPGPRWAWQVGAVLSSAAAFFVGTWELDALPPTFVPGQGVTQFKAFVELILCVGNLLAAVYFLRLSRKEADSLRSIYLGASCFLMGLGELTFMSYVDTSDFLVIFGHLYKVAAYVLIYAATFMLGMRRPFEMVTRSEQALRSKQAELDAVMSQVPAGLARLDAEGRYVYINERLAQWLGKRQKDIIGRRFEEVVAASRRAEVSYRWALALSGQTTSYEGVSFEDGDRSRYSSISIAPERGADGRIIGTIAVAIDTTEQQEMQQRLAASMREIGELKTALDAHAIVATTDARGVIISVNEKFCEISKYSREEVVGQTHRVINSGYHPAPFFQELWRTIASGKVWSGEICNRAKDGSLYWVNTTIVPFLGDDGRPERYVAIRADVTERKVFELQVQEMAYLDALTGLPNRRLFMDRLQQHLAMSARSGQHGALLFLDLDHFKEINDTLGHGAGDDLLKLVAERLRKAVRDSDTVSRLGGDEFVVLLSGLGADSEAATTQAGWLAEEILRALSDRYLLAGHDVLSTPSIGVVMCLGGEPRESPEELLKRADIALYQAKAAGRQTVCFFDPAIQEAFQKRMALEQDLREAMPNSQFEVFYQPIVNSRRETVALEALLRWRHPARGLVSPAEFIPVAEKTGLIIPIGQWVIERACADLARWDEDPKRRTWQIAVNVSARQFRQDGFVAQVIATMNSHQIGKGRLKLELTESSLQENLRDTVEKMKRLREHGVRFAIDDFGTGYSSLSYLKELPVDVLKIDRSFVRNVASDGDDAAIARMILALATHLDMEVVAEGVETESQFETLRSDGCTLYQGYLFGRPEPLPGRQVLGAGLA